MNKLMTTITGISGSLRSSGDESLLMRLVAMLEKANEYGAGLPKALEKRDFSLRESLVSNDLFEEGLIDARGKTRFSNTEFAVAAALFAAKQSGVAVDTLSLYRKDRDGAITLKSLDEIRAKIVDSRGLLMGSPVYFGDRNSLAQSFIDKNRQIFEELMGSGKKINKVFASLAIGAKRNGGQETTLIYQLMDMMSLGFMAVGNDAETTAQYGGTCLAGNKGSVLDDNYGLWTSMGTGKNLAHAVTILSMGEDFAWKEKKRPKVLFLILQDSLDGKARRRVESLVHDHGDQIDGTVLDITPEHVEPCIACDSCPTSFGEDEEYRCIIKDQRDFFVKHHPSLIGHDAIVPVVYTSGDARNIRSNYQSFVERTRYLRRSDFIFSDHMICPLVFFAAGGDYLMPTRMVTSFIRHRTVISKPIMAYLQDDRLADAGGFVHDLEGLFEHIRLNTLGRMAYAAKGGGGSKLYNPVGYVLKNPAETTNSHELRHAVVERRNERLADSLAHRTVPVTRSEQESKE